MSAGGFCKNDTFANKIQKFYLEILKQILGVNKKINSVKVLTDVGQFPLRINIETQMFKYLLSLLTLRIFFY